MARLDAAQKIQPHWLSKTLAGVICGLLLAYGMVALFAWFGPGGIDAPIKVQMNMWLIVPVWLVVLSTVYLFRTGLQAWLYLLAANAATYAFFFLFRWAL